MMRSSFLTVTIMAILLGLVACGGSDDDSSPTLTKAEFIKRADAICKKADAKQESAVRAYEKENPEALSTPAGQEEFILDIGLSPITVELDEISELGVPEGDEQAVNAIVSGFEDAVAKVEADPFSVASGPGPFLGVNKLTKAYGFKDCADLT
jgi:hypothetical protein